MHPSPQAKTAAPRPAFSSQQAVRAPLRPRRFVPKGKSGNLFLPQISPDVPPLRGNEEMREFPRVGAPIGVYSRPRTACARGLASLSIDG